jgi:hypothetical protein
MTSGPVFVVLVEGAAVTVADGLGVAAMKSPRFGYVVGASSSAAAPRSAEYGSVTSRVGMRAR